MSKATRRKFLQTSATLTAAAGCSLHSLAYAATAKKEWIQLFDGKTLNGWHINPEKIGHGTGGQWEVEEGTIAGQQDPPGSGNGGILLTDQKFDNFILEIDMKPDWGVCSGLYLRGNDLGQCFQMMVDYHDAGNVGHFYGEGTTAFNTRAFDINGKYDSDGNLIGISTDKHITAQQAGLVDTCTPQAWVKAWKLNDWNRARVIMDGAFPHITTFINGLKVGEFDGNTSMAARYDKEKILGMLGPAGSIAVQVHAGEGWPLGAKCRWKNIRIQPL